MKSVIPLIAVFTSVLVVMNLVAVAALSIEHSRWMRIFTVAAFIFAYYFHYSSKTRFLLGAFIAFFIADIFTLSFEVDFSQNAYFTLHGIAFLFLFIHINKGAKKILWTKFQKLFILCSFFLCLAVLLALGINFQNEIDGYWHLIFFYFHGLSAIACMIAALGFYDSTVNSFAMFYLIASLFLIFSDLTAFPAQYLKAEGFYYASRIFYVTGLASLVQFAYLTTQSRLIKVEHIIPSKNINEKEEDNFYHNY